MKLLNRKKQVLENTGMSQLDYNWVEKVHDLQQVLMCPSDKDLSNAIKNNVIGNSSFTCWDVVNANKLFGSDIAALKAYYLNYYQCIPICKKRKEYILTAIEQRCNEYK